MVNREFGKTSESQNIMKMIGGKYNKINRLHQRCKQMIFSDKKSTFIELLEKDNSVLIHRRNLRFLATEMFKKKFGPCNN